MKITYKNSNGSENTVSGSASLDCLSNNQNINAEITKVFIYSKDPSDNTISGNVGDANSNATNRIINPKDITHITVENS